MQHVTSKKTQFTYFGRGPDDDKIFRSNLPAIEGLQPCRELWQESHFRLLVHILDTVVTFEELSEDRRGMEGMKWKGGEGREGR